MDRLDVISAVQRYASENLVKTFVPGRTYIPAASPSLDISDITELAEVLLQFWYTEWKYCRKFERELEKVTEKSHVLLVNSGSSANLVAITAAIRFFDPQHKKQYILTCATGFPTTVSPILQNGYTPIYIDMNIDLTPNMAQVKEALSVFGDLIVGGIFSHTLGFIYDEVEMRNLLGPDRFLISDCCDALGAYLNDGPVGKHSDFSTYSFFPSHHIMAAEGGAVVTNDDDLILMATSISNWGRSCYCRPGESDTCGMRFCWEDRGEMPEGWDHKYIFSELGYNLKMTEFQGALGHSQIQRLDEFVLARRKNYQFLFNELSRDEYVKHLHLLPPSNAFSPFGFPVYVTSKDFDITEIIGYLEHKKIGTRRLFGGNLVHQPAFIDKSKLLIGELIGSDALMNRMFWISVGPYMTEDMLNYVVYVFDRFFVDMGLA